MPETAGRNRRLHGVTTLLTGITGYVGSALIEPLTAAGHELRGLARTPANADPRVPTVRGDLDTGDGLAEALDGVDTAYYLVHSMEGTTDFTGRERRAAERFAQAAGDAGVQRIVYMSVLTPHKPPAEYSDHVRSRIAVEQVLGTGGAEVVVLRASIVIGARSRSFRFLLRLVERLPVLLLPPWRHNRTMPIDERDLLRQLVRAATATVDRPVSVYDAVGRDEVSYQELIETIRDHLMVGRPTLPFPAAINTVAAPLAAAVAGEDLGLVHPLMHSLGSDLLPRRPDPHEVDLGHPRYHLDAAIEHALRTTDLPTEGDA